jgi:signal transduction histidine kinase
MTSPKKPKAPEGRTVESEKPQPFSIDATEREFLFRTFHDMRNPLHTILGYTSLVLRKSKEVLPEKQRENLEKVLVSAENLESMLERVIARYRSS